MADYFCKGCDYNNNGYCMKRKKQGLKDVVFCDDKKQGVENVISSLKKRIPTFSILVN